MLITHEQYYTHGHREPEWAPGDNFIYFLIQYSIILKLINKTQTIAFALLFVGPF